MILEEFTKIDWQTFAGCESKNPLISRHESESAKFALIVDDNSIEAVFMDGNGFLNDTTVTGEFGSRGQAILFGMQIAGTETPAEVVEIGSTYGGKMRLWPESLQAGRV